jgi:hypothetical protein
VLSAQRTLLRAAFREYRGRELGTEGDSFFVVFETAGEAVRCCVAAQRALVGHDWPCGVPVRVRMGLHSGERGRQRAADGLSLQRLSGDDFGATNSLSLLGSITSQMGRVSEAEAMFREALISHERLGNMSGIGWMLLELAATAVTRGQSARAILLSGAARSLEGKQGGGIAVHVLLHLAERINTAWDQLDPAQAERA